MLLLILSKLLLGVSCEIKLVEMLFGGQKSHRLTITRIYRLLRLEGRMVMSAYLVLMSPLEWVHDGRRMMARNELARA